MTSFLTKVHNNNAYICNSETLVFKKYYFSIQTCVFGELESFHNLNVQNISRLEHKIQVGMCIQQIFISSCATAIGVAPITHVRNKNSIIQGRSPNVVKVIFHTIRNYS